MSFSPCLLELEVEEGPIFWKGILKANEEPKGVVKALPSLYFLLHMSDCILCSTCLND